jgi:radical SAM superfamily enzyme YgiQ (UPF0313 family)
LNTSHGCIGNCTFCGYNRTPWSGRTPPSIIDEILNVYHKYNIRAFCFSDNSIEDPKEFGKNRLKLIANELLNTNIKFALNGYIRADSFGENASDRQLLKLLREAGFTQFLIGIESGNEADLILYRKRASLSQNLSTINILSESNIQPTFGFMNLNPYSTVERLQNNYKFLDNINNYFPGHYFKHLVLYENTRIYQKVKEDGLLLKYGPLYTYRIPDHFARDYYKFVEEKYKDIEFSMCLFDIRNFLRTIYNFIQILDNESTMQSLEECKVNLSENNKEYFSSFFRTLNFNQLYDLFDYFKTNIIIQRDKIRNIYIKMLRKYYSQNKKIEVRL